MAKRETKSNVKAFLLVGSYVADWAILVILAVVGYVVNNLSPNKHAFSVVERSISYPFHDDTVSLTVVGLVCAVAPVAIIFVVTLLLVPGPTVPSGTPYRKIWKRKLWELHASWLGLAASLATAWFLTNGMKNLFGKPRPNLLARCDPDIANIARYVVGGFLTTTSDGRLVTAEICRNPDKTIIDEGFRSFPSGHSSFSAAGLVYLTLFLASRLGAWIPAFLSSGFSKTDSSFSAFPKLVGYRNISSAVQLEPRGNGQSNGHHLTNMALSGDTTSGSDTLAVRNQSAAPPLYLAVAMLFPFFTMIFILSSRWFDYQHHGFDIFAGSVVGTLTSYVSFRYYHLPVSRGAGWAWGPRSRDKSLWAGVGSDSYARNRMAYDSSNGDQV